MLARQVVRVSITVLCCLGLWGWMAPARVTQGVELEGADRAARSDQVRIARVIGAANWRLDSETRVRIARAVLRCRTRQALDPDLVLAVLLVESSARPEARSSMGAIGLMQVMPHMFEELGLPGNPAHIEMNVEAGCLLLADNIRRLGEERGISAYFWGGSIRGDSYLRRVRTVMGGLARGTSRRTSTDG